MASADGGRERFEALFREHHAAVRRFARRRMPAEDVDDIVSETFLVARRPRAARRAAPS
jgi:DNA-directed RNA polymerase specialized sigma24 family protein